MAFVKKLFYSLALFVIIIITGLIVITYFFEDKIADLVLAEVKEQIQTDIEVSGSSCSVLTSLPNARLNLENIRIEDKLGEDLIRANSFYCNVSLLDLWTGKVNIKEIGLIGGELNLRVDNNGHEAYEILKEQRSDTQGAQQIAMREAKLEDIKVNYINQRLKEAWEIYLPNSENDIQWENNQLLISTISEITGLIPAVNKQQAIELVLESKIILDQTDNNLLFKDTRLAVNGELYNVDGWYNLSSDLYDLNVQADQFSLASAAGVLPDSLADYALSDYQLEGEGSIALSIKKVKHKSNHPEALLVFDLEDGTMHSPFQNSPLQDVSVSGNYSLKSDGNWLLMLDQLKGKLQGDKVIIKGSAGGRDDIDVALNINGTLPINEVLKLESIEHSEGGFEIEDFNFSGNYIPGLSRWGNVNFSGDATVDDAIFTVKGSQWQLDRADLQFKNQEISIRKFQTEFADSEIELNLDIKNTLDHFLYHNKPLLVDGKITANNFELDEFLKLFDLEQELNTTEGLSTNEGIQGTLHFEFDDFSHGKIKGSDFEGDLLFSGKKMTAEGEAKLMSGKLIADATLDWKERLALSTSVYAQHIDINECFRQTENFGQDFISYQNLNGNLEAYAIIDAHWDEQGVFLKDELEVTSDIRVNEGELVDFELLKQFSSYVDEASLSHIKFSHLRNWLQIKNGKVYIPVMFIQSNAMNLTMDGVHSLDNQTAYNIKVNGGQVLMNKLLKKKSGLKPQKAKKDGLFNLYFKVNGDDHKFEFEQNKGYVKRSFIQSEDLKNELIDLIQKKFQNKSLFKEPDAWIADIPEYESEEDGNEEFLEEFK